MLERLGRGADVVFSQPHLEDGVDAFHKREAAKKRNNRRVESRNLLFKKHHLTSRRRSEQPSGSTTHLGASSHRRTSLEAFRGWPPAI